MSYVHIEPATKLVAVRQYWQTGNLTRTARKFGVSRTTLYEWVRVAETHLAHAFELAKPGKRTATLSEQTQTLQTQLAQVLDAYHTLSQRSPLSAAVARCPRCHGTALLRNGRVRTKRHGVRQRLWCRPCNRSVYIELKKTL
jgi:transposase-like protein